MDKRARQSVFVSLHWDVTLDDVCVCQGQTSLDVVCGDVSFVCIDQEKKCVGVFSVGRRMVYVCVCSLAPSKSLFQDVSVTKSSVF